MPEAYRFGAYHLETDEHLLLRDGRPVSLPPKAFDLLVDLVRHAGHLREKQQLMDALWPGTFVEEANLAYTVSALRKGLGDGREDARYIETVPTKGYRFVAPVSQVSATSQRASQVTVDGTCDDGPAAARPTSWPRTALRVVLPTAAIAAAIAGLAVGFIVRAVRPASPAAIVRTQLDIAPADEVDTMRRPISTALIPTRGGLNTAFTWTPNGRSLVFVGYGNGTQQIYVRDLDSPRARVLAGTEGARAVAVSPDGQTVVFFANGAIVRVPLGGGPVQTVVSQVWPVGMTVGVTGVVVFSSEGDRIWRSTGEAPAIPVTSLERGETAHVLPQLLASDAVLLFTVRRSGTWGHERIVAQVLATGERKVLLQDAVDARYVPTGHLVFLRRGLLMAVPFDVGRLAVTGRPVAVLDGVAQALTGANTRVTTGAGQYSVSRTGALAYIPSAVMPDAGSALVTVDRQGRVSPLPGEVRNYSPVLRLSPDGRRLAMRISSLTEGPLWTLDLARGSFTKLTSGGEAGTPCWTPDGHRIAFDSLTDGVAHLVWQRADGSAPPERLVTDDVLPSSWSPDGRHLAVMKDADIWVVTVGSGQPTLVRITETPEVESHPVFSPDGRWLAYTSNITGRDEVYVRPYPGPGSTLPVSVGGGTNPAWNPQGGELLYLVFVPGLHAGNPWGLRMMSVTIKGGQPGQPRRLFDFTEDLGIGCTPVRCYDVTPDGQQLVAIRPIPRDPPPPVTHINLVQNWVEELKAKVPVK